MRKTKGFTLVTVIIIVLLIGLIVAGFSPQITANLKLGVQRIQQAQTIYGAQGGIMYAIFTYRKYGAYQQMSLTFPNGLSGICGKEQSNFMLVNSSQSTLTSSNRYLVNWTIKNVHRTSNIVLTHITVTWTPSTATERIQRIIIGGVTVWNGNALSGSKIDINDLTFPPLSSTISNNQFWFNANMSAKKIMATFHFKDNSSYPAQLYPPDGAELQLKSTAKIGNYRRTLQARYDTPSGAITRWDEVYEHLQF